jgi:hypothetical protein
MLESAHIRKAIEKNVKLRTWQAETKLEERSWKNEVALSINLKLNIDTTVKLKILIRK